MKGKESISFHRYTKVFLLQLKVIRLTSGPDLFDVDDPSFNLLDLAAEEGRRAVRFKAAETYLEAAPQLLLQVYITYKRTSIVEGT